MNLSTVWQRIAEQIKVDKKKVAALVLSRAFFSLNIQHPSKEIMSRIEDRIGILLF